jgi:hypothetical protein
MNNSTRIILTGILFIVLYALYYILKHAAKGQVKEFYIFARETYSFKRQPFLAWSILLGQLLICIAYIIVYIIVIIYG